jgi:hypothetical protein
MIGNDQELHAAQERITDFQRILAQLRVKATPEEFPAMASGYCAEMETMQAEVMAYLMRHVSQPAASES